MGRARDRASADLNGQEFILDADADTSISADTDDQIDIKIAGADDFKFTANNFTALDSSNVVFGTGSDAKIFHDGSNTKFQHTGSGQLYIGADTFNITNGATDTNRVVINADVTISDGNLVVASGHGIDFALTGNGSGSMSSELFDDYEEGTWTAGSAVGSLNGSDVHYTKVGRLVHFTVKGSFANSSNNEDIEITGLPYAPAVSQAAGQAMWRDLGTNFQGGIAYVTTGSRIVFFDDGTTATAHNNLRHNEIGSSNEVVVSGTYFT